MPTAQNTTALAPRFAHLLKTDLRPLTAADGLEPDLHTRTYIRVLNEAGSRALEGSHLYLHRALTRPELDNANKCVGGFNMGPTRRRLLQRSPENIRPP